MSAQAGIEGLEVRWDDKLLGKSEWNAEFPVDAGNHKLSASASGRQTWTTTVGVGSDADRRTIDIPILVTSTETATGSSSASGSKTRTMAYVLAGTGIVLVGATVMARLEVGSALDDRKTACLSQVTPTCDDTGKSKVRTWEAASFVTGGLALASIGAAVYLFASGTNSESAASEAFLSGMRVVADEVSEHRCRVAPDEERQAESDRRHAWVGEGRLVALPKGSVAHLAEARLATNARSKPVSFLSARA